LLDLTMNRRTFLLASATASAALLLGSRASAGPLDQALAKLTTARAKLKTLQASFRQTRVIGLLATEVESKGSMIFVRPDRLRWQLDPPDAVTYWVGPEGFAMATAHGVLKVGKTAAGRFAAVLADVLVLLGGDLQKLRERYELTVTEPEDRLVLTAKPRADKNPELSKQVSELSMEFGPELWMVQRMSIVERSGDRSTMLFDALKRDLPVAPERMKPPAKR
jgi:outer membrane lipoprotein-sorting protein